MAAGLPAEPIVTINGRDVPPGDFGTHPPLKKEEHVA
jgi:hypothetical protein